MTIGERIKARRIEVGLSVDQVAERIGKNRATVYRYESNDIEKYTLDVLIPLAEVLRTTPAYLMGWEENAIPSNIKSTPERLQIAHSGANAGRDRENVVFMPAPKYNIIRIAGRDGSYQEKYLNDEQLAAVKAIIDQLPDASDEI